MCAFERSEKGMDFIMTKLKEYLIRRSREYVKPRNEKKLFIAIIILIILSTFFMPSIISFISGIGAIWILIFMILTNAQEVLMVTVKKNEELIMKNNMLYVLLSDHKFVDEYIFDFIIIPVNAFILFKYQLNLILWIFIGFILVVLGGIMSSLISTYFRIKLLD